MSPVRSRLAVLLANDAQSFAPPALANKMLLIKAPFTPNENMLPANITPADFTGADPIDVPVGAQSIGIDPNSQQWVIDIKMPVGGWRWQVTALDNLPQTIYGFAMLDNGMTNIVCIETLPVPITLTAAFDYVNIGEAKTTFVLQPLS
jgi:hypothetical protein